jgi:hypothetical protein
MNDHIRARKHEYVIFTYSSFSPFPDPYRAACRPSRKAQGERVARYGSGQREDGKSRLWISCPIFHRSAFVLPLPPIPLGLCLATFGWEKSKDPDQAGGPFDPRLTSFWTMTLPNSVKNTGAGRCQL